MLGLSAVASGNAPAALLSALLLGAILGFLPFNLSHHRKTFLGDAGSMLLGFLLPAIAIAGARFTGDSTGVLVVLGAAAIPVLDTLTTIVRRRRNGVGHLPPRLDARAPPADPVRTDAEAHRARHPRDDAAPAPGRCVAVLVPGLAVCGSLPRSRSASPFWASRSSAGATTRRPERVPGDPLLPAGCAGRHDARLRGDVAMAEILADGTVLADGGAAPRAPESPRLARAAHEPVRPTSCPRGSRPGRTATASAPPRRRSPRPLCAWFARRIRWPRRPPRPLRPRSSSRRARSSRSAGPEGSGRSSPRARD